MPELLVVHGRRRIGKTELLSHLGRWWGQVPTGDGRRTEEREIDVVGVDGNRKPLALGLCKWTSRPVDFAELNLLDRLAPHVGPAGAHRYLFSRSGLHPSCPTPPSRS